MTVPTLVSGAPAGPLPASQDFPASVWDILASKEDKLTQTPIEYTIIVPGNRRAHHDLYKRFRRAIYDPWWRPPAHLEKTDPYHFRHGLMAPVILASLEQEHPPASIIPLAHEYDRAYGPQGYNLYQIIPRAERDQLLGLLVVDGQVDIQKYGRLLEEAALNLQLQQTAGKNVQPAVEDHSVDLSEIQAKLRKIDREVLHPSSAWKEMPPPSPPPRPTAEPRTKATLGPT